MSDHTSNRSHRVDTGHRRVDAPNLCTGQRKAITGRWDGQDGRLAYRDKQEM